MVLYATNSTDNNQSCDIYYSNLCFLMQILLLEMNWILTSIFGPLPIIYPPCLSCKCCFFHNKRSVGFERKAVMKMVLELGKGEIIFMQELVAVTVNIQKHIQMQQKVIKWQKQSWAGFIYIVNNINKK